jgi:outer membrane receptor for monomeric catechols
MDGQTNYTYQPGTPADAGDHHLLYNFGVPTTARLFNTPAFSKNEATVTGIFFQDSWTMNRLTLNIGGRWDRYVGRLPNQESSGGSFAAARSVQAREVIDQSIAVWRAGASYDLTGERPHGSQGQLQPLCAPGGHRPRHQRQPADGW